jgi:Flp pilus assembly protein TadG
MRANLHNARSRRPLSPGRRRRGVLSIELILILPILLTLLVGMFEFSALLVARQQLVAASREGARVAALGGDATAVQQAVQQYLGTGNLAGAQVQAVLTDSSGNPVASGDPVTVAVQIPATQAVPDMLRFVGFSMQNVTLTAQTVMRKE